MKVKVSTTIGGGIMVCLHPTNSNKKSINWVENHFPLKRFRKHLIAKRRILMLSLNEINSVINKIRAKSFNGYTWGPEGAIQLFISP